MCDPSAIVRGDKLLHTVAGNTRHDHLTRRKLDRVEDQNRLDPVRRVPTKADEVSSALAVRAKLGPRCRKRHQNCKGTLLIERSGDVRRQETKRFGEFGRKLLAIYGRAMLAGDPESLPIQIHVRSGLIDDGVARGSIPLRRGAPLDLHLGQQPIDRLITGSSTSLALGNPRPLRILRGGWHCQVGSLVTHAPSLVDERQTDPS